MLDAFIIENIRREREQRETGLQPLRIEVPQHPEGWAPDNMSPDRGFPREKRRDDEFDAPERGVAIIDYSI